MLRFVKSCCSLRKSLRFSFRMPDCRPILVFDGYQAGILRKTILEDRPYNILDFRFGELPCVIYVAPSVLLTAVWRFLSGAGRTWYWNWKKRLFFSYLCAAIERLRPKAVISFKGCFSMWYGALANRFKDITFIAVTPAQIHAKQIKELLASPVHYYVFGEFDVDQFRRIGHPLEKIHPVGPLLGGYYFTRENRQSTKRYDICIPSAVPNFAFLNSPKATAYNRRISIYIERRIAEYVSRYAMEFGLRVGVALRPQEVATAEYDFERHFYLDTMDCDLEIIPNDYENFSTYSVIAQSEVVVTHYSTTGFETLAWPKKVLFCQFSPFETFPLPSQIKWQVTEDNYEAFSRVLSRLRALDYHSYFQENADCIRYFNSLALKRPPHFIIIRHLNELTADD